MHRYYRLAKGTGPFPRSNNVPWPYEISLCFDAVRQPVGFSEGVGHGSMGGLFSVAEALHPQWREHFSSANGDWLIPYLERLSKGTPLDKNELLAIAKEHLRHDPESYEVPSAIAARR